MSTSQEHYVSTVLAVARRAAGQVVPRFPGLPYADAVQDATEWLLRHPERVRHHTLPDGTIGGMLSVECAGQVSRASYRSSARARVVPITEDTYRYGKAVVEMALPGVWEPEHRPLGKLPLEHNSTRSDPAVGGDWRCIIADVQRAVAAACGATERRVLFLRSVLGQHWEDIGVSLGVSGSTSRRRYTAAITAILDFLNGAEETRREGEPTRHVMTNAAAQAMTDQQWDG